MNTGWAERVSRFGKLIKNKLIKVISIQNANLIQLGLNITQVFASIVDTLRAKGTLSHYRQTAISNKLIKDESAAYTQNGMNTQVE